MDDPPNPRADLEARALELRQKMVPMAPSHAHANMWKKSGIFAEGPLAHKSSRAADKPAKLDNFAAEHGLRLGGDLAREDAKSQYKALSRALFSDDKQQEQLKDLAVEFLRVNKAEYYESFTKYELGRKSVTGLRERLAQLLATKDVSSIDYDGWCQALDSYDERGGLVTLDALVMLLHVEVRLVISHPIAANDKPHIKCSTLSPTERTGHQPRCIVYLAWEQKHGSAYFASLEEDLSKAGLPGDSVMDDNDDKASVAYTEGSVHTNWQEEDIPLMGETYSLGSLMAGFQYGERGKRIIAVRTRGTMEIIIFSEDIRTGFLEELKRHQLVHVQGPPKPKSVTPQPLRPLTEIAVDDAKQWETLLRNKGPGATIELAQCLLDELYTYVERTSLVNQQGISQEFYIDRLGTKMFSLIESTKAIKLQMHEAISEVHDRFKVVVVGVEGAGKTTTVNQIMRHLAKSDNALGQANPQLGVTQTISRLYAHEKMDGIKTQVETAEADLDAKLEHFPDHALLNDQDDDILPTGTGTAITALPTTLKFNPEANVATLRLVYRPTNDVRASLRLQDYFISTSTSESMLCVVSRVLAGA